MKVERIAPIPLDKKQALTYAAVVAAEYGRGSVASAKYLGGGSFGRAVGVTMDDGSRRRRPMVVIRLRNAADQQQTAQYDGEHSHENLLNVRFSDARRPQRKEGLHKRRSKNFPLNRASENPLRRAHAAPFRKRYVFFPQGPFVRRLCGRALLRRGGASRTSGT